MNPTFLIIKREFTTRVRKKTFLILTILGPLLFGALMVIPGYMATRPESEKTIAVLDEPNILVPHPGSNLYNFQYLNPQEFNFESAQDALQEGDKFDALLYIPSGQGWDPDFISRNVVLLGQEDISISMERYVENLLEDKIAKHKLLNQGVDPAVVEASKTNVTLKALKTSDKEQEDGPVASATSIKMGLGYVAGISIYFFIFMYSVQVMRGVIEEKTNRIVEVIISSVRPFQLMLGKILGIGAVGLLQFLIWVVLSGIIYLAVTSFLYEALFGVEQAAQMLEGAELEALTDKGMNIFNMLAAINWPLVVGSFAFYFFGGYFIYSALFAAVGSAIDQEADSQQFMLPITIPLIVALASSGSIIQDPHSDFAFWLSQIPLTSPVVMMIRIPFGVPAWEIALSMALVVIFFFLVVKLAAKIYRVGILMYGKKVSWKEMFKWMRY